MIKKQLYKQVGGEKSLWNNENMKIGSLMFDLHL